MQLGAVCHELKEVYHDAGRAAVLVQIGVGVEVRVDQNLKGGAGCVVGGDVVFLSGGQVELVAGVDVLVVLVKQGRAPGGVIAVHLGQGVIDQLQGGAVVLAHGNVAVLRVKGVDDPLVVGLAQPIGNGRCDHPGAQRQRKFLVRVEVDRRVGKAVLLCVIDKALVAAVAAAAHADGHAVVGFVVACNDAAVAGLDGQHCGQIGDRLAG